MLRFPKPLQVQTIAEQIKATVVGDASVWVDHLAALDEGSERSLVFSLGKKINKPVGCVLARAPMEQAQATLIVPDPKGAMRQLLQHFGPSFQEGRSGIHPTAVLGTGVKLGRGVSIGPYAVLEDGVELGEGTHIGSHAHVMREVRIGQHCVLGPGVICYPGVLIGHRVEIGAHAVLGDTGFGYDWTDQGWTLFPQVGSLVIEDDVSIGPLSLVDRGALSATRIGSGTKLDAHTIVGHGVQMDAGVIIAAGTAIGGSTKIGRGVVMGGRVSIADHVNITAGTRLGGGASVASDIRQAGDYASAMPVLSKKKWRQWLRFILRTVADDSSL